MNKFLKVNFIYFSLLCFIILNLSCEQSEVFSPHVGSDDNTYYFPDDTYQCMPKDGYTALFERMLNHKNIIYYLIII